MVRIPEPAYMQDERDRLKAAGALQGAPEAGPALTYPMKGAGAMAGPALQAGPVVANQSMGQPPRPTGRGPAGNPPSQPALADSQAAAAPPPMTPIDMIEQTDPDVLMAAAEQSADVAARTSQSNPEASAQVEGALKQSGIDVETAYTELRDQLIDQASKAVAGREPPQYNETDWRTRWKNVFNIVPRDQMGLFLMDFGMRMMVAGGSGEGNFLTHVGQAGVPALAATQGRMAADEQAAVEREKDASRQAGVLVGLQMENARTEAQIARDRAQTKDATRIVPSQIIYDEDNKAYFDFGDGKGLTELTLKGKPLKVKGGGDQQRFAQEIMYENLRAVGYSEREAMDLMQGAPTAAEVRFKFSQTFDDLAYNKNTRAAPPGGAERTRMSEWTPAQRKAWIEARVSEISSARGQSASTPKTPDSGASGNRQRPPGFDKYD